MDLIYGTVEKSVEGQDLIKIMYETNKASAAPPDCRMWRGVWGDG